jgi:DNA-binding Lrp family transcriptional regulator
MSGGISIYSPRANLTVFEKRLCNALQKGLPIVDRPFLRIAGTLNCSENTIITKTRQLLRRGVIRRIGVVVNWRAVGKTSTLVTTHIEEKKLKKVIAAVNKLEGVSHNYLRDHHFNLWFTLRGDSESQINKILSRLSRQFVVKFYSLPAVQLFKLDVRFDAESGGRRLLPVLRPQSSDINPLSSVDRRILEGLQGGLKVVKRPFDFISKDKFEIYDGLLHIEEMIHSGLISRIGAIVNHNKLGFTANAMFVCAANGRKIVELGCKLARVNIVSHCYQRKTFKGWPYNLYAMFHGRNMKDIQKTVKKFVKTEAITAWQLLVTKKKLLNR